MHAGLAAGAALAALPVILHLFMRQTPKHVIFPALRLDPRTTKTVEKADADQELAPAFGSDGDLGLDGAGPGAAPGLFRSAPGRRIAADGIGPGVRYEPVDGIQR